MIAPPELSCFTIFGFNIYYYGIILAVAIFIGVLIANKIAIQEYFLPAIIPNISTSVIIGGIIGARLYYCLLNYEVYISSPLEIFAIREGGLSIHGAIIGGAIVLFYQAKKHKLEFMRLCDIFAVGIPLSQAIGRWGNFFNSEAFGIPTTLPWGMYVKPALRPDKYFSSEYFHPTFLYESILDLCIFFLILKLILPRYKDNLGIISACYILLYSIVRFFIEYIRVDCVKYVFGIPFPQIVSIVLIVLSLSFFVLKFHCQNNVKKY